MTRTGDYLLGSATNAGISMRRILFRSSRLLLAALEVGDHAAAGLRVLQQIGIDEHAQLGGMTKRGHATVDLGNPYANSTHKYTAQNVSTS